MKDSSNEPRRFSRPDIGLVLTITALLVLLGVCLPPAYEMYWQIKYYREAEALVAEIQSLTRELHSDFNEATVRERMAAKEHAHLQSLEIQAKPERGEMIWFGVNEGFDVGLGDDGRILWKVKDRE